MDRPERLRRDAALLLPLAVAACAAPPDQLRLEDRPGENLVRIVNPTSRTITLHVSDEPGFSGEFQLFRVRYRDGRGRPVIFNGGDRDSWWTPLTYSSQLYRRGQGPTQHLTILPGQSRDYSRSALFDWFDQWSHRDQMGVEGPCTAQLLVAGRVNRLTSRYFVIEGDWQPAACPGA